MSYASAQLLTESVSGSGIEAQEKANQPVRVLNS